MNHVETKKIFIGGATSAIAQAFAQRYAASGAQFYLVARSEAKLTIVKQDLLVRGASSVTTCAMNMAVLQNYAGTVADAIQVMGRVDIALLAQGVMHKQEDLQGSSQEGAAQLREMFQVNVLSVIEMATALANAFERQCAGTLLIISSVAGDRGRQSNYVYGSSKAALSVFTDGLRNRLAKKGVSVITVKPGFVDTPMTQDLDKGGPLWAKPEKIAADMEALVEKGGAILYTPWFWRYIMLIIKHIPEFVFKKLSL